MHGAAFGGCIGVAYLDAAAARAAAQAVAPARPDGALLHRLPGAVGIAAVLAPDALPRAGARRPRRGRRDRLRGGVGSSPGSACPPRPSSSPAWCSRRSHSRCRPSSGLHDRDGEGTLTHVVRETPLDVVTGAEGEGAYIARRVPAYPAILRLNQLAGPRRPGGDGDRPVRQLLRPARAGPRLRRLPGQRRALRRQAGVAADAPSPRSAPTTSWSTRTSAPAGASTGSSRICGRTALDPVYSQRGRAGCSGSAPLAKPRSASDPLQQRDRAPERVALPHPCGRSERSGLRTTRPDRAAEQPERSSRARVPCHQRPPSLPAPPLRPPARRACLRAAG